MAEQQTVLLDTVPNELIAQLWIDVLTDAGIQVFAKVGGPGVGAWGSAAMLEHELYVRRFQLAAAKEIIEVFNLEEEAP
ncbi:MAG: hypothetical protein M3354_06120 [Chloroflexota bacterium]|nr:hypothetical protein [Chloroflexota bacterium]